MREVMRSPWFAISLGILGLSLGYALVIQTHFEVYAANAYCPFKAACEQGDCAKKDCVSGNCKGNCPGCQKQKTT